MTRAGPEPAFVGRTAELASLLDLLRDAPADRPVAAVVLGDPGAGKSRLLAEALSRTAGAPGLRVTGFVPEQHVPLAAASALLRRLAPGALGETVGTDPLDRFRLFESCHEALARLPSPVLVCDDLQWVDDMSLSLLHHLLRAAQAERSPLVLLCAARPTPRSVGYVDALVRLLGHDCTQIALGPLDREDVLRLVRSTNPGLTDADEVAVCELSGGSPFWVERLAGAGPAGDPTDAALESWLRSLTQDGATLLALLAVCGRPLPPDEACDVLGWTAPQVTHAVAELANHGLVVQTGPSLRITHDVLREQARRLVPERDAVHLHRLVADSLERRAGEDPQLLMEALVHHRAGGALPTQLALRIARSPRRRLFGADGLAQLASVADARPADDPAVLALRLEVASLAGDIGERGMAYERAVSVIDLLPEGDARAEAALQAARHALALKRSTEAGRLLDQARHEVRRRPWLRVEVDALDSGRLAWLEHDTPAAADRMQAAVSAAHDLLDAAGGLQALDGREREAYAESLRAQRDIALMDDDLPQLIATSHQRVGATRGRGEEHLIALADDAIPLWYLNRWAEAAVRLQRVLDESRAQVYPALTAELCHALAYTRFQLGLLGQSRALVEEATRLEARLGTPTRRPVSWVRGSLTHLIDASARDWNHALRALHREADAEKDPHVRIRLRLWSATVAARFSGPPARDAVLTDLALGDDDGERAQCARCLAELRLVSVELYARVGELDPGHQLLARWDALHPAPVGRAADRRRQAQAALAAAADDADAADLLQEVVTTAQAAQMRLDELWGLIDLGRALQLRDQGRAVAAWSAALDLAVLLGARSETALVEQSLRSIGVRSRGGRAGAAGLSPRELEVARLAAAGARNADIAASLFLSTKTVERHLTNIFGKLGVRNRAELATHLARLEPIAPV